MSEHSGARQCRKQCGASERVSGASERANGRASGPVLTSGFLVILDHSVRERKNWLLAPEKEIHLDRNQAENKIC